MTAERGGNGSAAEPITASVKNFCGMSGLCRDKVFEMIKDGSLQSVRVGKLRLVVIESYRQFIGDRIRRDMSTKLVGKIVGKADLP